MQLEVIQHVGHLPKQARVAYEVVHPVESEGLTAIAGIDVR
jgi:hypothetical protein